LIHYVCEVGVCNLSAAVNPKNRSVCTTRAGLYLVTGSAGFLGSNIYRKIGADQEKNPFVSLFLR